MNRIEMIALFLVLVLLLGVSSCKKIEQASLNPDDVSTNLQTAVKKKEASITYENVVTKPKRNEKVKKYVVLGVVATTSTVAVVASAGTLAPAVGGWIGSTFMGLHGVAATNAGLALLGGGAIGSHAMAFGMAGGTFVVGTVTDVIVSYTADEMINRIAESSGNKFHKQADKELKLGNDAMAQSLYRESIANGEDIAKSYFAIALLESRKRNYDKAKEYLEKIIKEYPDSSMVIYQLGLVELASGNSDKGIGIIKECISKEPKWDEPYVTLFQAYIDRGTEAKAFESLMSGVKLNPDSYELNYQAGIIFSNKADWPAAAEYFTSAIKINDKSSDAFLLRALSYLKSGEKNKALDDFISVEKLLKDTTPFGVQLEIGDLYINKGEQENAFKYYEKAKQNINNQLAAKKDTNLEKALEDVEKRLRDKKPVSNPWWKVWG